MIIKIKGKNYKLNFVDKIEQDNDFETVGRFIKSKQLIEIVKDKPKFQLTDTIIHELVHAFFFECGLDDYCDNEELITWVARQFLDIFDVFVDVYEKVFPNMKGCFVKYKNVDKVKNEEKDFEDAENHIDNLELQLREQYQLVDNQDEEIKRLNQKIAELSKNKKKGR